MRNIPAIDEFLSCELIFEKWYNNFFDTFGRRAGNRMASREM